MELKKNPKLDVKKWSGTFFNLGLATSMAALLFAFEWKSVETVTIKDLPTGLEDWEMIELPITIQPPPPPPPAAPPELIAKPDDVIIDDLIDIDVDINTTEGTDIPEVEMEGPPVVETPDEIKDFVEVQASFKGGMDAWYEYLKNNLKYPSQARRMGIEGVVFVRFVVNTDGSIQDIELLRTIGGGADEVAKEVIENSPHWNPGKMRGRAVRSRMTMPIRFKLTK